jgi:hypothetical protein
MMMLLLLLKLPTLEDWVGGVALFVTFFVVLIWAAVLI